MPLGKDEKDNKEVRKVGKPPKLAFKPKQHFEIGEALGLMDFETAAKISGARFVVLKGALARLERALAAFMLDLHTRRRKTDLAAIARTTSPLLVKDHTAYGTGNLPKFAEDLFQTSNSWTDEASSTAQLCEARSLNRGSGSEQIALAKASWRSRLTKSEFAQYAEVSVWSYEAVDADF